MFSGYRYNNNDLTRDKISILLNKILKHIFYIVIYKKIFIILIIKQFHLIRDLTRVNLDKSLPSPDHVSLVTFFDSRIFHQELNSYIVWRVSVRYEMCLLLMVRATCSGILNLKKCETSVFSLKYWTISQEGTF